MSRFDRYIIEARDESGALLLGDYPQPETVFGIGAITGLTADDMARVIFRRVPDATLDGGSIACWPKLVNLNWIARRKTW